MLSSGGNILVEVADNDGEDILLSAKNKNVSVLSNDDGDGIKTPALSDDDDMYGAVEDVTDD
eukprot:11762201-Ditylum_brightwellii.AAC.1